MGTEEGVAATTVDRTDTWRESVPVDAAAAEDVGATLVGSLGISAGTVRRQAPRTAPGAEGAITAGKMGT